MDEVEDKNNILPSAVGDINMPSSIIPVDMDFEFIPKNPFMMQAEIPALGESKLLSGNVEKSGFLETAGAELKEWNYTYQALDAGNNLLNSPLEDIPEAGWTPKSNQEMFLNVREQYYNYMLGATGPKEQARRLGIVMAEQKQDDILANGGMLAKVLGGLAGIITDPISYIPIVGWVKYAKLAPTAIKSAQRALPGIATAAVLQSGAKQADKANGNLTDFFTEAFVNTVAGTVLFGGIGAAAVTLEKMELMNLTKYAKNYMDGIDFKLNVNAKGIIDGFKAVDVDGSLSAAKVSFAQDLADSAFAKSGVFKIPYVGEAVTRFLTLPILGTPLPKLLTSSIDAFNAAFDRILDHTLITKGNLEGRASPIKFETLMKQTFSSMRALSVQIDALHLERNGLDITNRPLGGLANLGLGLKNKTLEVLGKDLEKSDYISKEDFYIEIENVLYSKDASPHSSVNKAAEMYREKMDETYKAYREAYNLPEDWMPPRTAAGYLMRVYDTAFMNTNEKPWIKTISNYLQEADQIIESRMAPIRELEAGYKEAKEAHLALVKTGNATAEEVGNSVRALEARERRLRKERETLQDELRSNPDHNLHVDDWTAFSAKEAKQLKALLKPKAEAEKLVEAKQSEISDLNTAIFRTESKAAKSRDQIKAKAQSDEVQKMRADLKKQQDELKALKDKVFEQEDILQEKAINGEIDSRFFTREPGEFTVKFKDPENRLKFRDTYETHAQREAHAKAYYDTILNQTAEETIAQVMGKMHGNKAENHIKQRTLLIPDEVLYKGNFMSRDLPAKVNNYVNYLSRRTHLKTVFNDVTVEGGLDHIVMEATRQYDRLRQPLNDRKDALVAKLADANPTEKKAIEKQIKSIDKELVAKRKEFERGKSNLNHIYEKMMGIRKMSRGARQAQSAIMSLTAMANLPFVPFTMINDLSANGLQHGVWPFIRDGVYPIIESLGGILKTKDSEAFRKTAPSIHLALQDILNGYADKNWSMYTEPYLNLGKWVGGLEKVAHSSSNFTLTTYFDNGLQRIAGSISQSEFMRILHAYKAGTMTKKEGLYLLKYGIDPKIWADRMLETFAKDGGGKTKLGGYQSNFWNWQDLEASNHFSRAVYRAVQSTTIQRGLADSPFWADNAILSIVHGFSGWMYASVNRYVIPSLQQPDAQKLVGVLFMLGTGSLVSPLRRMARGEQAIPDNMTDKQRLWETIQDSGYMSYFTTIMADANLLSGGNLLGDLKNDKYKDRTRAGLLGPAWGTGNRMADIISAIASNEWNENDAKKAARMLPYANASWTWWMSKSLIEGLHLPKTRAQARALKQIN